MLHIKVDVLVFPYFVILIVFRKTTFSLRIKSLGLEHIPLSIRGTVGSGLAQLGTSLQSLQYFRKAGRGTVGCMTVMFSTVADRTL